MTKVITNMLAEHLKLMLYSLKAFLGGVNLVGLRYPFNSQSGRLQNLLKDRPAEGVS